MSNILLQTWWQMTPSDKKNDVKKSREMELETTFAYSENVLVHVIKGIASKWQNWKMLGTETVCIFLFAERQKGFHFFFFRDLQFVQNHEPLGGCLRPMHCVWNHCIGQSSPSHANIRPNSGWLHMQYKSVATIKFKQWTRN